MEVAGRQAQCPNCGGPIAWKLGSSHAQVCPFCRFAVVRTDRDLRAVGKVADLVPTAAVMTAGDIGRIGDQGFTVGGRIQLDHGKGPWDEWYVELAGGRWGWLAKAQGNWYLTFPVQTGGLPTWEQMSPGAGGQLPGAGEHHWTVTERGQSTVVSSEGELPWVAASGQRGRYVDLSAPGGGFATIDYGDGTEAPVLFVGAQHAHDQITWQHSAMGPRPEQVVGVQRLNCPSCGGPVPIFVPDQTERAACPQCNSLLDFDRGALSLLSQLNQPPIEPHIPLGTEGTLDGEKVMCIGVMERFVVVDGISYPWREYLLHADAGYRWLMEENGNFTLSKPVNPADVTVSGMKASYGGRKHDLFQTGMPQVSIVVGEFYWQVAQGESSQTVDYIAPPYILSEERTGGEVHWSAGRYVSGQEVWKAFGLPGSPLRSADVSPCQPNPIKLAFPLVFALVFLGLLAGVYLLSRESTPVATLVDGPIAMPAAPEQALVAAGNATATGSLGGTPNVATSGPSVAVSFTPPFALPAEVDELRVMMNSNVGHGWLGVACALINESTGAMYEFSLEQDHFHDPGTAVNAAGRVTEATIGGLAPGSYVLRLDPRWARKPQQSDAMIVPAANLRVSTSSAGKDSTGCFCIAIVLILLPVPFTFVRRRWFESRRWRNSNVR